MTGRRLLGFGRCRAAAYNSLAMTQAPTLAPPRAAGRTDRLALSFLVACALLAALLIFANALPIWLTALAIAGLLAVFIWRAVATRTVLPATAVDWPNVLALLLLPVGLWASHDPAASWPTIVKVIAGFGLFYGVAGLADSRWVDWLPWLLVAAAALASLAVLFGTRWFTSKLPFVPDQIYAALPSLTSNNPLAGFHPNLAGALMASLFLPALALAVWSGERRLRAAAIAVAVLTGLALFLTQSRGAWAGLAVALLVAPALRYRRWWIVIAVVGGLLAVALAARGPSMVHQMMAAPLTDETAINTLPGRLELWSRALAILGDSGLTGVGPGLFEPVVMRLYPPFFTGVQGGFFHPHNVYLQTAVDFGVGGAVALVALGLGLGASLVAATRRLPDAAAAGGRQLSLHSMAIGLFGSLVMMAAHGLVDSSLSPPRGYAVAFALFGAAAALANHLSRTPTNAQPAARETGR